MRTAADVLLCAACDQEIAVDEVAVPRRDGFVHERCEVEP